MRPRTPPVAVLLLKVDAAVEAERARGQDVDPLRAEVGGRVDDGDVAGLEEVVCDEQVLLVGRDLDVVRADDALRGVGVVEALDVREVADVQGRDVVGGREGD